MAKHYPDNLLADFCGLRSVVLISVIMMLLAIVMLLVPGQSLTATWESLGMLTMFLLWLGMSCLAVLCLLSPLLRHLSMPMSSMIVFVIIQLMTLLVSEIAYQLTLYLDILAYLRPDRHGLFLLRNVAISIIISGVALRYMFLQKQLQMRTVAENQARIQALQARIRPHFLFNSMNTIAALTQVDADAAEKAVLDLSEIYRAILSSDDAMTTLEEEISLTRHYLEIERLRLHERLHINWQLDESLMSMRLPALVVQPLVENAVYHGIEKRTDGGAITIAVSMNDRLQIVITNPLAGSDDDSLRDGNQLAIGNICERLQLAYGGGASLESSQDETDYRVVISIPVEKK
jgi:two-component system sensor histidine kinase AlgZ